MKKYNPKNERIKKKYFEWQKEANQKSESTIDNIRRSITRYEIYTKHQDFSSFNKDKAIHFKENLRNQKAKRSGQPLSKSTIFHTLKNLKNFFTWLSYETGFKSKIKKGDIEYLNLSEKDVRTAKSPKFKEYPTLEQIKKVISSMPFDTEIQKRNRALIAFTILSGMRDSATISLRLKHIDLQKELIKQDPSEVKTKFSKRIDTYFFPVGDDIKSIVIEWIDYLYKEKLFSDNDPVFPRTRVINVNNSFIADGVDPTFWETAGQVRNIFKDAFTNAGLKYFSPHTFRNTLATFGEKICQNPEQFKAWSQNLGHEQVLTTFQSYGTISTYRQAEIIRNLTLVNEDDSNTEKISKEICLLLKKLV